MAMAMNMATLLTERALIPGVGALQEGVQVATVTKYIAAASFVLVVYDWLLTFDQEVRLMWKAEWSLVKFLIFFVRYASIVGMFMHTYHLAGFRGPLSNSFCQVWTVIGGVMEILAIGASNWLLMLRLTSLYASQRMLVWFLYGYYILAYASSFVFLAFSLKEILRTMVYSPVIHLCVTTTKHPVMVGIFCAPFTFEMVVFIMTAYKAVQHAQMIPPSRRKETPFLFVLHRDGLTYHVLLTVVRIWNIYVYLCLPINYIWMAINILWSVVCTFTARIFLNLRGVAHPLNLYESETTSIPTIITQPHHLGHHHGSTSDILVSPTSPRTPKSSYSASGLLTPSSVWKSQSNVFTHSDLEMSNVTKSLDRVGHYTKAKNKPLVRQTTRESTKGKRSKEQSGTVRSLPNNRVHVEIEVRQVREDW